MQMFSNRKLDLMELRLSSITREEEKKMKISMNMTSIFIIRPGTGGLTSGATSTPGAIGAPELTNEAYPHLIN